jgi:2-dehydro-3-deoxyphosphogalactonate aldolase
MTIGQLIEAGAPPVVAILRGVTPEQAPEIGRALLEGGIGVMEVPLNSPRPLESIERLCEAFGGQALIGAGTVLSAAQVEAAAAAGARLIVSPHTDPAVIGRAVALGLECLPGFMSPSEAFAALAAGARQLKLFPAASLGPGYLKALREVLPRASGVWAVGGTGAHDLAAWLQAGASGIGVGGSLYRAGDAAAVVEERARALQTAWRGLQASGALGGG